MLAGAIAATAFGVAAAVADHRPVYVMPHRSGAPTIINGVDATGAFVEGDWGLHRPGHGSVTVVPGLAPLPAPSGGYFPATGYQPGYGRHEVEPVPPPRPLPAPRYRRDWSTDRRSDVVAPFYDFEPLPDPPEVIEAPAQRSGARPLRGQRRALR